MSSGSIKQKPTVIYSLRCLLAHTMLVVKPTLLVTWVQGQRYNLAVVSEQLLLCVVQACRLFATYSGAAIMPLGRRSDCGDAKFAGVELALPASDTETALQVVFAAGRTEEATQADTSLLHRTLPLVVSTSSRRRCAGHLFLVILSCPCSP